MIHPLFEYEEQLELFKEEEQPVKTLSLAEKLHEKSKLLSKKFHTVIIHQQIAENDSIQPNERPGFKPDPDLL